MSTIVLVLTINPSKAIDKYMITIQRSVKDCEKNGHKFSTPYCGWHHKT